MGCLGKNFACAAFGVRQRVPFRRGAAAYASASYRSADERIRFMLLEAVLVISDGVEAVLSSAADALIQPLLLQ